MLKKKGDATKDNAEVQRNLRDLYEYLYGNKVDNLKKWTDS